MEYSLDCYTRKDIYYRRIENGVYWSFVYKRRSLLGVKPKPSVTQLFNWAQLFSCLGHWNLLKPLQKSVWYQSIIFTVLLPVSGITFIVAATLVNIYKAIWLNILEPCAKGVGMKGDHGKRWCNISNVDLIYSVVSLDQWYVVLLISAITSGCAFTGNAKEWIKIGGILLSL